MNQLETLIERNQQFATTYTNELSIAPRFSTIILSCIDARVDPADILGLKAGDALVMRNAGGRITDDVILELSVLSGLMQKMRGGQFPGFTLVVIQHTDCGMSKIASPEIIAGLSQGLGVEQSKVAGLAIHDHEQGIKDDIARLKSNSITPKNLKVVAYLLDIETGLLNEVAS